MKIVILTTTTSHHNFFVKEIAARYPISLVIEELSSVKPVFETFHPSEPLRDEYEWELFFQGTRSKLSDYAQTESVESINDDRTYSLLSTISPNIVIDFGTRKVNSRVISLCPAGFINLHGGNPQLYRGLDTHLWSIYHQDFNQLVVTLHRLTESLDTGDILQMRSISLLKDLKYHQLRSENVKVCIALVQEALDVFALKGAFTSIPQNGLGRYYSFMPTALKNICVERFEKYTARL